MLDKFPAGSASVASSSVSRDDQSGRFPADPRDEEWWSEEGRGQNWVSRG